MRRTRLGNYGGPRSAYGSFAGKVEAKARGKWHLNPVGVDNWVINLDGTSDWSINSDGPDYWSDDGN